MPSALLLKGVDIRTVFLAHGGLCDVCDAPVAFERAVFDHVVPLTKGGSDDPINLRPAHPRCNTFKGAQPLEWAREHIHGWLARRAMRSPAVEEAVAKLGGVGAVARLLGVRERTVERWKVLGRVPDAASCVRLAAHLGLPTDPRLQRLAGVAED